MAVPATTARVLPTGFKMPDGFKSYLAPAAKPGINIWYNSIKPSAFDGGDPIPTTTMENVKYRTMRAKQLISCTPITVVGLYDPDVLADLLSLINVEGAFTEGFPDHTTIDYFAYIQKAEPGELKEGEPPMITVTVVPTNWDPVNSVEQGPVVTPAAGT